MLVSLACSMESPQSLSGHPHPYRSQRRYGIDTERHCANQTIAPMHKQRGGQRGTAMSHRYQCFAHRGPADRHRTRPVQLNHGAVLTRHVQTSDTCRRIAWNCLRCRTHSSRTSIVNGRYSILVIAICSLRITVQQAGIRERCVGCANRAANL